MTVTNCTINGNTGEAGAGGTGASNGLPGKGNGGLSSFSGASSTVRNTISAGNVGENGGADVDGDFTSGGHNLIGSGDHSSGFTNGVNGDHVGTDANPLRAKLGLLANNGGPTSTMALQLGSPAINAGNDATAPATDQRGYGRNSTSDIGAFEFDGAPPVAFRIDALIKKNSEASTAFAINDIYQLTPHGLQIERQSVTAGVTAIYQVKVENDTNKSHTFGVKAGESIGGGWTIVYKRGSTNITTAIKSTAGYKTGVLVPGASEIITVQMTPNTGASASKSSTLKLFLSGKDKVTRDAVKATTTRLVSGMPL
jgi:hypothetical protein